MATGYVKSISLLEIIKSMEHIEWSDFEKVDLRVGEIINVEDFPEARKPAYKLKVDFGSEIGIRKSSAQITELYSKDDLINKRIVGVVNFPPRQIGPFISECLVTGFKNDEGYVALCTPDMDVPLDQSFIK